MKVLRLAIHQLEKESRTRGIKLYNSSNTLMILDPGIDRMFEEIHKSFELDKTRHCKFIPEQVTNTVMLNTNKYLMDERDEVFMDYTKASLDNLASRIENEVFATGGYYLFADYTFNETRYLAIILARKKDGFNIEFNDQASTFDFKDTKNINTDKLAMAYRLNTGIYANRATNDRNYMALVTNQGDKMSDYFIKWVNASEPVNGRIQTGILVSALKNIGSPDPEEDETTFQNRAYHYIYDYKKINKGSVNIDKISEYLYGDPALLRKYISEELDRDIDPDIRPDIGSLKSLIQIKAQVNGIIVTIEASRFGNDVDLLPGGLLIRNQSIINQIQSQRNAEE
ncbi:nucleoid-associated protein YejK [Pedobacter sp. AK013]|uniref:nucleoid-associated protein n=1 Tax=Pedobacter sp. AK013 TaxID=2723071 RepID=UPI001611E7C3|nr:nucleoid-associated protein [Pedobacter sp. AK013]MBB6236764.1 nucleoid-associated protein YejK [Pedobacter sp. AK013]